MKKIPGSTGWWSTKHSWLNLFHFTELLKTSTVLSGKAYFQGLGALWISTVSRGQDSQEKTVAWDSQQTQMRHCYTYFCWRTDNKINLITFEDNLKTIKENEGQTGLYIILFREWWETTKSKAGTGKLKKAIADESKSIWVYCTVRTVCDMLDIQVKSIPVNKEDLKWQVRLRRAITGIKKIRGSCRVNYLIKANEASRRLKRKIRKVAISE